MQLPVFSGLAWNGQGTTFLVLLAFSFFSDALDGWVARSFKLRTELGARLDSFSDFFLYGTMALGGWLLWPHILWQERYSVLLLLACLILPTLVGLFKFQQTTSYHTWAVKLAALAIGGGGMLLFAGGPLMTIPSGAACVVICSHRTDHHRLYSCYTPEQCAHSLACHELIIGIEGRDNPLCSIWGHVIFVPPWMLMLSEPFLASQSGGYQWMKSSL